MERVEAGAADLRAAIFDGPGDAGKAVELATALLDDGVGSEVWARELSLSYGRGGPRRLPAAFGTLLAVLNVQPRGLGAVRTAPLALRSTGVKITDTDLYKVPPARRDSEEAQC